MDSLKAENLLRDSEILNMIERLKAGLRYKTDDTYVSFDDHFLTLQAQVDGIKRIQLADNVVPALGAVYENELLSHLEEIQDQVERISISIIRFQGDIARADADTKEIAVAFEAWYTIAAKEFISTTAIKLPEATLKSLGKTEFTRLMSQSNLGLSSLSEALKVLLRQLDGKKKLAQAKLQLGRDQINAAHFNRLPETMGVNPERPRFNLIVDEDNDTPAPAAPFLASDKKPLPAFLDEDEEPIKVESITESPTRIDSILAEEDELSDVPETSEVPEVLTKTTVQEVVVHVPNTHDKEVADALKVLEVLKNIPTITTPILGGVLETKPVATPTGRRSILDDLEEEVTPTQTVVGFTATEAPNTSTPDASKPVLSEEYPDLKVISAGMAATLTAVTTSDTTTPVTAAKPTSKLVFLDEE
jgi:hypothetical protein